MKRGSSTRLIEAPMTSVVIGGLLSVVSAGRSSGPGSEGGRRFADRGDDVLVARATTEIALDPVANLVVRGIRVARKQVRGGHDHARSTEAALEAVFLPERILEGVQAALWGHPLDRPDRAPVRLYGQDRARLDRRPIELDG